jgi:hypothetical protein
MTLTPYVPPYIFRRQTIFIFNPTTCSVPNLHHTVSVINPLTTSIPHLRNLYSLISSLPPSLKSITSHPHHQPNNKLQLPPKQSKKNLNPQRNYTSRCIWDCISLLHFPGGYSFCGNTAKDSFGARNSLQLISERA